MKKHELNRREFIKDTLGATAMLAATPMFNACSESYDPKDLQTSLLGNTGVRIPRIALGLGSRFCSITDEDKSLEMLNYALDNGLFYWDTAWVYENNSNGVISEERIGKVLKHRRDEIFLSTKVTSRDPSEAVRQIETSLKRLNTDHLDMLMIHSVESLEDVSQMRMSGQLISIVKRMKDEGVARFIGFSGHGNAEAMKAMVDLNDFDSMLIAMNHWNFEKNQQQRQELAIPAALKNGMGVILMKVVRPRENIDSLQPEDLVRFALSLDGPHGIVLGMDSIEVVRSNLKILRNFIPMRKDEKVRFSNTLLPFFKHENLEWMDSSYRDGDWV